MRPTRLLARVLVLAVARCTRPAGRRHDRRPTGVAIRAGAVVGQLPAGASRTLGVRLHRLDYLVGVTWAAGAAQVRLRWHSRSGWSAWSGLPTDTGVPDTTRAGERPGRHRAGLAADRCRHGARPGDGHGATRRSPGRCRRRRDAAPLRRHRIGRGGIRPSRARALLHAPRLGCERVDATLRSRLRRGPTAPSSSITPRRATTTQPATCRG